ncbi:SH3 domain-containing protein 19 isoform X3 [Puntigrus tetrazona]|uniref:SH3 domain-containing protein 19 isoform X3 n=1 Tax=Puntigrus tetrazona TaxID=1606681 RepID=UPI001C894002|nr:SH3 domain-containing protein 19 isoform X3 [Puntigrus tetrazona]
MIVILRRKRTAFVKRIIFFCIESEPALLTVIICLLTRLTSPLLQQDPSLAGQGPLSSIKAAFKRTSARAHSQPDCSRERRRPEITILSAEPLTATSWHSGVSRQIPSTAFTTQPIWSESVLTSAQLPPSYEQVIKEKTKEQVTTPLPSPRRSHTTIATQTDSLEENVTHPDSCTLQNPSGVSEKQPKKPPRPSLPCKPDQKNRSSTCTSNSQPNVDVVSITRPVPQPRSKTNPLSSSNQVNVQPLIPLQDSWEGCPVTLVETSDAHSGKYLQELLDVFSSDPQSDLSDSVSIQGEQTRQSENMTSFHSDRNILSKIQAFESQSSKENDESSVPFPRPRKVFAKPPVLAPKPSIAPRPSVKKPKEEQVSEFVSHLYEEVDMPPMPAPRPQLLKKPSLDFRNVDSQPSFRTALIPPSRPSLVRGKNVSSPDEEEVALKGPPTPLKPSKDLLNLNNHNSTALLSNITSTANMLGNDYMDAPLNHSPTKPSRQGGFTYMGLQGVTKRPTVIRVPSKTDKNPEEAADVPPPLPVQKAVGGPPTPAKPSREVRPYSAISTNNSRATSNQADSFSFSSDMSLPPRPSGGKVLPPRPPPAKAGPGRPPPPRKDGSQRRPSDPGVSQIVPSKQQQPQWQQQNRRASKKGPALPPRPNPGHRLYNKYTLEIPHGVAEYDYNGTNTGELSFQKNEVLVLLEELDNKTFVCQVGNAKGTVQKTHMKIITPLISIPRNPVLQKNSSFSGMVENTGSSQVQALYDFTPEGPGELMLKAGDVVSNVEQLDSEWYMGTCRNITGFFPINYVKTLVTGVQKYSLHTEVDGEHVGDVSTVINNLFKPATSAPPPRNEWKTKPFPDPVRGPRCVARFDFEGEQGDELSFSEGDVIRLKEYVGEEWARGEVGGHAGIFPLNFVEVLEDLPSMQKSVPNKIALPGMAGSPNTRMSYTATEVERNGEEWAVALYDFTAETDEDLPFQQGDRVLVTAHIDDEWWSGRVNGREGFFPKAFVETLPGGRKW